MSDGTQRDALRPGMRVRVVLKRDQSTGKLTEGVVDRLLTKAAVHTRGIKVRLVDGQVGRVREIVTDGSPCASG